MSEQNEPTKRTATAIRFPADVHDQLVEAAAERRLSVNYIVTAAVEDFLPRLTPADEFSLARPAKAS